MSAKRKSGPLLVVARVRTRCTSNWFRLTCMSSSLSENTRSPPEPSKPCFPDLVCSTTDTSLFVSQFDSFQANSPKTRQMKSTFGKYLRMFCKKFVNTLHTKSDTQIARLRSPSSRLHPKSLWSFWWRPTFLTAEAEAETQVRYRFQAIYWPYLLQLS